MRAEELQQEELEQVSGGADDNLGDNDVECWNCGEVFNREFQEKRTVEDDCHSFTIYKCPKCKHWVEYNGRLYE